MLVLSPPRPLLSILHPPFFSDSLVSSHSSSKAVRVQWQCKSAFCVFGSSTFVRGAQQGDPSVLVMGSTCICHWGHCHCGRWLWPLQGDYCAECSSDRDWVWIMGQVKCCGNMERIALVRVVHQDLGPAIESLRSMLVRTPESIWGRKYLRWISCTRGSHLAQFSYFHGGLVGSLDDYTDIIDLIIEFVI